MLKFEVDSLESVEESQRSFYKETEGGKFRLDVDGLEDTGALKRAKDREKERAQKAEEAAKTLEGQLTDLQKQIEEAKKAGHIEKGDVEALEKSWAEKYSKLEELSAGKEKALQGQLNQLLVDNKAIQIASELAVEGSADVLLPHIKTRLTAIEKDGQLVTSVLDSDGKPSALTLDELKTEIASNKAFAPLIAGSKASGGGFGGGGNGGGGGKIEYSKSTPKQIVENIKSQKG